MCFCFCSFHFNSSDPVAWGHRLGQTFMVTAQFAVLLNDLVTCCLHVVWSCTADHSSQSGRCFIRPALSSPPSSWKPTRAARNSTEVKHEPDFLRVGVDQLTWAPACHRQPERNKLPSPRKPRNAKTTLSAIVCLFVCVKSRKECAILWRSNH